jgi:hypothetical protein
LKRPKNKLTTQLIVTNVHVNSSNSSFNVNAAAAVKNEQGKEESFKGDVNLDEASSKKSAKNEDKYKTGGNRHQDIGFQLTISNFQYTRLS